MASLVFIYVPLESKFCTKVELWDRKYFRDPKVGIEEEWKLFGTHFVMPGQFYPAATSDMRQVRLHDVLLGPPGEKRGHLGVVEGGKSKPSVA